MPVQVTIIGLGRTGASIGLALAKIKDQVFRVGNDREPGVARQAEKMGAVDKTMINLPASVREADVVILALPVDEVRETLEVIAQDLKPGSVLIDTSPVKTRVMEWVQELLPGEDRYFVSLTLTLNPAYLMEMEDGAEKAHADLFQNSLALVTNLPGNDESALTLATNIIHVLGATPLFTENIEADGLLAKSHVLPHIVAAALVNATIDDPGWREARKVAGQAYAQTTEQALHHEESKDLGKAALMNAENTIHTLDQLIAELRAIRDAIKEQDEAALRDRLEHAREGRRQWLYQRLSGEWEPKQQQQAPTGSEVIGRLFGGRLFSQRSKGDKDKNKEKR